MYVILFVSTVDVLNVLQSHTKPSSLKEICQQQVIVEQESQQVVGSPATTIM